MLTDPNRLDEIEDEIAELQRKVADHDQQLRRQSIRIDAVVRVATRDTLDALLERLRRLVLDRP